MRKRSCGYTSAGELWISGHRRLPSASPFKEGSFVGCGVVYPTGQLFFTLDGEIVKTEEKFGGKLLYPTVGLHAAGQTIRANFGDSSRFCFDLEAKRQEVRAANLAQIEALPLPSFSRVIYNYLLFHGYKDSAEAFASTNPPDLEPLTERDTMLLSTLELRSQVRRHILGGELEPVKSQLISNFGDIASSSEAMFAIECQIFIEHIRRKELSDAIELSQTTFLSWWSESTQQQIEDCCALLAYSFPEKSPAADMLSPLRIESTADLVNRSILRWTGITGIMPGEDEPDLARLLAHLAKVHGQIRVSRGAGEIFDLDIFSTPPPRPNTTSPVPLSSSTSNMSPLKPLSAATSSVSLMGSRR
jgi:hypothetical protein